MWPFSARASTRLRGLSDKQIVYHESTKTNGPLRGPRGAGGLDCTVLTSGLIQSADASGVDHAPPLGGIVVALDTEKTWRAITGRPAYAKHSQTSIPAPLRPPQGVVVTARQNCLNPRFVFIVPPLQPRLAVIWREQGVLTPARTSNRSSKTATSAPEITHILDVEGRSSWCTPMRPGAVAVVAVTYVLLLYNSPKRPGRSLGFLRYPLCRYPGPRGSPNIVSCSVAPVPD